MNNTLIKNASKNFISNAVYIFIPMGIIYLFLLIGINFFISGFVQSLGTTISSLSDLIKTSAESSSASVNEFISYTLTELRGNGDIIEILKRVLNPQWVRNVFEGFFALLNESTEGFETQFTQIVNDFIRVNITYLIVTIIFCALGVILANFATGYAIRRRTAKRGIKKFIFAHTLFPLFQSLIIIGALFLLIIIKLYGILLFAALLFIMSGLSLINAWFIHRDGNIKLKEILTGKNILSQVVLSLLALLFNVVLTALLLLISPILAVLIMLPVLIYTLKIAEINADSFVCNKLENNNRDPSAE